jgi:hypothetical protein
MEQTGEGICLRQTNPASLSHLLCPSVLLSVPVAMSFLAQLKNFDACPFARRSSRRTERDEPGRERETRQEGRRDLAQITDNCTLLFSLRIRSQAER